MTPESDTANMGDPAFHPLGPTPLNNDFHKPMHNASGVWACYFVKISNTNLLS